MIRHYIKKDLKVSEIESLQPSSWINIQPPFNHEELNSLSSRLSIPLDFLTDSLDIDERSRYEREDDIILIVVNTPVINEKGNESEAIYITAPIGIILTKENIITITSVENPIIQKFLENRVKHFNPTDHRMFVLQLFEQTVFRFLECLKKLNLKRNLIEQELYNSSRNKELQELLRIEKSLVYFVNSLSSNELLKMKMKRTDLLKIRDMEEHMDLFEDIIIDNSQALEMSNVYTNILSGTMEAYASIVSNNLNFFIQRLTIITIILMLPTLIASLFGMNVDLPFSDSEYTFYFILVASLVLGFLMIWFLRRRKVI
jgi:magnesium transporter